MKRTWVLLLALAAMMTSLAAHTTGLPGVPMDRERLRQHIADEFMAQRTALAKQEGTPSMLRRPVQVASAAPAVDLVSLLPISAFAAPSGNGALMAASFAPFRPKVRFYWDTNYFYAESDGIPDRVRQPDLMVGITAWQQQVPLPAAYFASTTNGTTNTGSLGYQQPNYWKIPLVPVPAASPISLTDNFLRGAVALGADGIAIFNPRNNTGQFSQAIGELDAYGGHCGRGDDYHYHIFPVHLTPVLGNAKPIAWGLDGYPVYGYVEPDGSAMKVLDGDGGHDHDTWGYHYHARGTFNPGINTWTPSAPYMMNAMHGTVVNYDSQIDPQPTASGLRASGTGGYTAQPVPGAAIMAFKNPVALTTDGSGHFVEDIGGAASGDNWLMRYTVSGVAYDLCWRLNRNANPKTMTITWRHPASGTTTTTYANIGNRITAYPMAAPSRMNLPDTSQTLDTTVTFGEDADFTLHAQSFADNGDGTIQDNITGLMWQKLDNGESTWENAVTNAASVTTGGYTDWRLPTPSELFGILNFNTGNPALDTAFFPNNPAGAANYFWTSDIYGASTTNVWCANSGGGLGSKPKAETLSAGGTFRYHARYVRGAQPTNSHNYQNNGDGTVTDLDTGLMWQQAPGSAATWDAALSYANNLTLGGYSDWRMPNIKELQTLTDYTLATATTTTGIKPSINRTLFPAAAPTAHWSSTSQRNDSTRAWVVEFGINAAASPPRNAQGLISYEAKTSAYPVFAVRTTSVIATQIQVSHNGATLMDGISVVSHGSVNVGGTSSKIFTITNTGSTVLNITGVTIDGANAGLFEVTTPPANSIDPGAMTMLTVRFTASSPGSKTAALHIANSDSTVGSSFDITLTGAGLVAPPGITNVATTPTEPIETDSPYVTALVTSGSPLTSVQLSYSTGIQSTNTIFTETMATEATTGTGGWDGTGAVYSWTPVSLDGAGNIKQTAGTPNHTAAGGCGLVLGKGSSTNTDPTRTMVTLTHPINATGTFTAGSSATNYVEFWVRTVGLSAGNGWTFQLAPDGATWSERISEFSGSVHGYQLYHYNLLATDLTSALKMRFGFTGNGVGGPGGSSVNIDDIVVVTTSGSAPVTVTMFDDGAHGDGAAGDGVYGVALPAQNAGVTVTYSITATDNLAQMTTLTAAGNYTVRQAPVTAAPNVVIILTDDQGWGDVSYHTAPGQVPVQTPNMERIGTEGVRLEKFYATPVCSVTRAAMLTGRNSLRTNSGNHRGIGLTEHLMPQSFKAAGYQTFMCGKWHNGGIRNNINTATLNGTTFTVIQEGSEYLPHHRGWDTHYGLYGGAIHYFSHTTSDPGLNNSLDWWLNGALLVETTDLQGNGGYSTDLLADKAVAQILTRDKARPLLLYLAFNGVHAGVQAPQSYITKYQNLGVADSARRTLCAAVDCMDVAIGRVLGALDSEGIANNTLVIYMSDNGGNEPTGSINDPLRGTKSDSYDGGIHTPAAMRWPGVLPSGVISHQYVWVGDIFPTVCAAAGVTPQNTKPFDGINLWPALLAASGTTAVQRPVPLVTGDPGGPVAFDTFVDPVNGGSKVFKLIRNRAGTVITNELFNMTDDPGEAADLLLGASAEFYSAIVSTLTTAITSIAIENYPPYIGEAPKTQTVQQGSTITLYSSFTSYRPPVVQWKKNGTGITGAEVVQVMNSSGSAVNGVYLTTLTLAGVNAFASGDYSITVTSTSGSATSNAGALTIIKPVSTQNDGIPDNWKIAHGIDPNSSAALDGPLGDIDRDGRNNLLEYAFNTDPRAHGSESVRAVSTTRAADGLTYLEVSYPRRIGALDLAYAVEISDDLATWPSPGTASEVVSIAANPDGITETVTVRVLPAPGAATKKFARVRITVQ